MLGSKVRSSFICRNSCLLNINSGVSEETFRQPLAAPYLAALACLFHACGSRQPPEGRPPPLVSRVHAAQRQPLVWQSGLIKRAHLRSVTPFNLLHVKERISPACKPAQSQLAAPEIIAGVRALLTRSHPSHCGLEIGW